MENDDRKWEILQSEYLIKRPWLTARRDRVRLPNGVINDEYYVLEYPDWVNVIAITKEGDFLMERQYRHGLQWTGYELCAGVCEAGEDPLESARRELYEETGYAGGGLGEAHDDFRKHEYHDESLSLLCGNGSGACIRPASGRNGGYFGSSPFGGRGTPPAYGQ